MPGFGKASYPLSPIGTTEDNSPSQSSLWDLVGSECLDPSVETLCHYHIVPPGLVVVVGRVRRPDKHASGLRTRPTDFGASVRSVLILPLVHSLSEPRP